jgi:hypothetical protein
MGVNLGFRLKGRASKRILVATRRFVLDLDGPLALLLGVMVIRLELGELTS